MDVKCCKCGEPWDQYYLRHELSDEEKDDGTWEFGDNVLHVKQCPCCDAYSDSPLHDAIQERNRNASMAMLSDMLGDDLDGLASLAEDFDFIEDLEI